MVLVNDDTTDIFILFDITYFDAYVIFKLVISLHEARDVNFIDAV